MDKIKELKSLRELYEDGAITDIELETLKAEILNTGNSFSLAKNNANTVAVSPTPTTVYPHHAESLQQLADTNGIDAYTSTKTTERAKISTLVIVLIAIIVAIIITVGMFLMQTSNQATVETETSIDAQETTVTEEEIFLEEELNNTVEETVSETEAENEGAFDLQSLPQHVSSFIPSGYKALNATSGNLNLDSFEDLILVLNKVDEHELSEMDENPVKRPLLILVGQPDNSYKLAYQSNDAVYCVNCGGVYGDPFSGITIKNGYFSVEHYGGSSWRWTRIITFKYSPSEGNWLLSRDGGDSYNVDNPDAVESNIKTAKDFGKVRFDEFNIYQEEEQMQ